MHLRLSFVSCFTVLSVLLGAAPAASAASLLDDYRDTLARGQHAILADIDNDSMLLKRDDGFYTSGLRITSQHTLSTANAATTAGWRIGQELYTASDINLPPSRLSRSDHPYAGWLYAGAFHRIDRADGSYRQLGLDVGCLGPCAGGEWTQKNLHRIINQPQPQAWSTQLRNEVGVVLHGAMSPGRWAPSPSVDVTPGVYGRFGNIFTDAGVNVQVRAGRLNVLPQAPALYGFFRADARAVAWNATVEGGYFSKDNPTAVSPKRAVGEIEAGVTWQNARYGLSASVVRRSNEVAGLPNSIGNQNFARVQLVYRP